MCQEEIKDLVNIMNKYRITKYFYSNLFNLNFYPRNYYL